MIARCAEGSSTLSRSHTPPSDIRLQNSHNRPVKWEANYFSTKITINLEDQKLPFFIVEQIRFLPELLWQRVGKIVLSAYKFPTDYIRGTREDNIFSHNCLSICPQKRGTYYMMHWDRQGHPYTLSLLPWEREGIHPILA